MLAPVTRMRKKDIVWLATHKCKHSMTYLTHYNCYLKENPDRQRTGYLDIETTDFKADWGILLLYSIMDEAGNFYENRIEIEDMRNSKVMDKKIVRQCVEDLKRFDLIIGYYHSGFDLKFLRTRAVINNIPFPHYDEIQQKDVYYMVRNRFQLTRNSLKNACLTLLGKSYKTDMNRAAWRAATLCGDKRAMDYIAEHCHYDVLDVSRLYKKVIDYSRPVEKSI
jgi:uncharacterized protein YprB with RNaseH-like and TPR domain